MIFKTLFITLRKYFRVEIKFKSLKSPLKSESEPEPFYYFIHYPLS